MSAVDEEVSPRVASRWTGGLRSLTARVSGSRAPERRPSVPTLRPVTAPAKAGPAPRSSSSETPDSLCERRPLRARPAEPRVQPLSPGTAHSLRFELRSVARMRHLVVSTAWKPRLSREGEPISLPCQSGLCSPLRTRTCAVLTASESQCTVAKTVRLSAQDLPSPRIFRRPVRSGGGWLSKREVTRSSWGEWLLRVDVILRGRERRYPCRVHVGA